ncbi:restriction endonuclease subunit S [Corynebacterium amycolatum]|uniref:restriction endonuclease subunit S n=1 Tax=Corynebacterium amycolatum TaxID=43765 RepID=UPI003165990D
MKEGKLKKQKPLPPVTSDEKPFEIPSTWSWVRLLEISIQMSPGGKTAKTGNLSSDGKYPVVSQSAQTIDGYIDDRKGLQYVEELPVVIFGDHNRVVKIVSDPFVVGADGTKILRPVCVDFKYLHALLLYASGELRDRGYGRHFGLLKAMALPLPPLAEQERIVAKLDQIIPMIDKLEKLEREREQI